VFAKEAKLRSSAMFVERMEKTDFQPRRGGMSGENIVPPRELRRHPCKEVAAIKRLDSFANIFQKSALTVSKEYIQ